MEACLEICKHWLIAALGSAIPSAPTCTITTYAQPLHTPLLQRRVRSCGLILNNLRLSEAHVDGGQYHVLVRCGNKNDYASGRPRGWLSPAPSSTSTKDHHGAGTYGSNTGEALLLHIETIYMLKQSSFSLRCLFLKRTLLDI